MTTMALEAQKASLAREILNMDDESIINDVWQMVKQWNAALHQQKKPKKREIGFLEGKAKVIFHDDWEMTPEELDMV